MIIFTIDKNDLEDPNVRIWKKAKLTLVNFKQVDFFEAPTIITEFTFK